MLPIELRERIVEFAQAQRKLRKPVTAYNKCSEMAWRFQMCCDERGCKGVGTVRAERPIGAHLPGYQLSRMHVANIFDGTIIDYTARQFWPDSPWPLIESVQVYRARFLFLQDAFPEVTSYVGFVHTPRCCNGSGVRTICNCALSTPPSFTSVVPESDTQISGPARRLVSCTP